MPLFDGDRSGGNAIRLLTCTDALHSVSEGAFQQLINR